MLSDKKELLNKIKEEFPEIFLDNLIVLSLLTATILRCEEYDKNSLPVRYVLFEKQGNIPGKKARLIKMLNQLSLNPWNLK
jgi:hypothetical protein